MNTSEVNHVIQKRPHRPSALSLLSCKCPRCRTGKMFKQSNPWNLRRVLDMHERCPECNQPLSLEVGFYYGASYVSYALSLILAGAVFVCWFLFVGFSTDRLFYAWLITNAVVLLILQPWLMRLARTGWLWFFVRYDRDWRTNAPAEPERTNASQEANW